MRLSAVDLLVLTSLDQLLLILANAFFYKTSCLNEEVNRTEPSPSVSVPWSVHVFNFELRPTLITTKSCLFARWGRERGGCTGGSGRMKLSLILCFNWLKQ